MKKLHLVLLGIVACALIMPQLAWGKVKPDEKGWVDVYSTLQTSNYDVELIQISGAAGGSYSFRFKIVGPIDGQNQFTFGGPGGPGGVYKVQFYKTVNLSYVTPGSPEFKILDNTRFEYKFTVGGTVDGIKQLSILISLYDRQWITDPSEKQVLWHSPKIALAACKLVANTECAVGSDACVGAERVYGSQACVTQVGVFIATLLPIVINITPLDTDGDGVLDSDDNCKDEPNPNQINTDGDQKGDACDLDADGDGVSNIQDNCPLVANADQADKDEDQLGDACDSVDDSAGIMPMIESDAELEAVGDDSIADLWRRMAGDGGCSLMAHAPAGFSMLALLGFAVATIALIRRRK